MTRRSERVRSVKRVVRECRTLFRQDHGERPSMNEKRKGNGLPTEKNRLVGEPEMRPSFRNGRRSVPTILG